MRNKNGFTLIESLIAVATIGIMSLITLPVIINNLGKPKRLYNYQISFLSRKANTYSLENLSELVWENTDVDDLKKTTVVLRKLLKENSSDIINPVTNKPYNPDETIVTIYKFPDGHAEYVYGNESPIVNSFEQQYVLKDTSYDVMDGIYVNSNGQQSTKNLTASCTYASKDISCDKLLDQDKETGEYNISYKYADWQDSRTVEVIEASKITITTQINENDEDVVVTINYPENAMSMTYLDNSGVHSYKNSFSAKENQTITANCIDKYGFNCVTETKKITKSKPSIEYDNQINEILITASWPNSTGMELDIGGVKTLNGTEYKCKVGNKETSWSSNSKCSVTGLESGKAYTVVVYARDKVDTANQLTKTTTIYTAKEVTSQATTGTGTCPTDATKQVESSEMYDSTTLQGSCTVSYKTCSASGMLTSYTSDLPDTMVVSCNGVTSIVSGGSLKSSMSVVSCSVPGSSLMNLSSCTTSIATCNDITSTISGTCTSSIIKSGSTYNCSSLSKNACSRTVTSVSTSYYSCIQGGYGNSTCYSTSTKNSTSYYGCSVLSKISVAGCLQWNCIKRSTTKRCVSISGGKSSCSTSKVCVASSCGVVDIEEIYVWEPQGCSTVVKKNVQVAYSCSGYVSYRATCSSTKITSSTSYYDCSVKSTCSTNSITTVYSTIYPSVVLSSNKTIYYKEYSTNNLVYDTEYVINYSSSIAKPRKSVY